MSDPTLSDEELGLLKAAINNVGQEMFGTGDFDREVGVETVHRVTLSADAKVALAYHSVKSDRYNGLIESLGEAGEEVRELKNDWYTCPCGNILLYSEPADGEKNDCPDCGNAVPYRDADA